MSEQETLLKKHRKKPLFDIASLPVSLSYGREDIKKIIPHREPMLFVDRLLGLDREQGLMYGQRYMDPDDPVFQGHFPDAPMYPGNFTIEMIGQLGLCMYYFEEQGRSDIAEQATPVPARATRIAGAHYLKPVEPGKTVTLLAKKLEYDGFFASMIGQALVDGEVAVTVIGEVVIL
ncbi:3-hydroxyacyl-ACP dehydratase FabZ family protein [Salinispira pacifica]|uniref:3-hydroxyacyl-[acyl-carrier-protein] dehydratase, FabZ form n=1 Tax=Salinispira pacifica TaxID=1307761 RepID=V5WE50_9SPIO|nr:3-hydroxyacyl-ACP dehydratase FabZ family protein [Salinispira pacifica]AHC13854.1 3-hydroxyacyl-[acyl-carrier-protein] dehydratase, FabZ form [Salinispira pacifica]